MIPFPPYSLYENQEEVENKQKKSDMIPFEKCFKKRCVSWNTSRMQGSLTLNDPDLSK